ncbi:hypothetical protein MRX96_004139 [Rhipicephalus microplus]
MTHWSYQYAGEVPALKDSLGQAGPWHSAVFSRDAASRSHQASAFLPSFVAVLFAGTTIKARNCPRAYLVLKRTGHCFFDCGEDILTIVGTKSFSSHHAFSQVPTSS